MGAFTNVVSLESGCFYLRDLITAPDIKERGNLYCSAFNFTTNANIVDNSSAVDNLNDKDMNWRYSVSDRIYIKNVSTTTLAQFKAYIKNLYLYYEKNS